MLRKFLIYFFASDGRSSQLEEEEEDYIPYQKKKECEGFGPLAALETVMETIALIFAKEPVAVIRGLTQCLEFRLSKIH